MRRYRQAENTSFWLASAGLWGVFCLLSLAPNAARAEDPTEQQATQAFIDRFEKLAANKNVQGKSKSANGKVKASNGPKKSFNFDDGAPFQSDLTYHDLSFNTTEQEEGEKGADGKAGPKKVSRLFSFVSPHGAIAEGSGSSELERVAYKLHKKFTKQDEENDFKNDDDKAGIKFRSIFKITTQEVAPPPGKDKNGAGAAGAAGGNAEDPTQEPDKVERFEMRAEVRPDIEKVGSDSFEEVKRAARDENFEDDNSTLSNGLRLRFAAGEASATLWNSTLSNLVQRRVNRGIRPGGLPFPPQLSERSASCGRWAQTANTALNNVAKERREELVKDVERMTQQCEQLAALPFDAVDARFEADDKGEEKLVQKGPQKEDGQIRDMRVQLEVWANPSKAPTDIKSNYRYNPDDGKAKLTVDFDQQGQAQQESTMTMPEQIESYNSQLRAAAAGYEEVKKRLPGLTVDTQSILDRQIKPGEEDLVTLNQRGAKIIAGEIGQGVQTEKAGRLYREVLEASQKGPAGQVVNADEGTAIEIDPAAGLGSPTTDKVIAIDEGAGK